MICLKVRHVFFFFLFFFLQISKLDFFCCLQNVCICFSVAMRSKCHFYGLAFLKSVALKETKKKKHFQIGASTVGRYRN